MSPLPKESGSSREEMHILPEPEESGQRKTKTLGIDYLEIPCSLASGPDRTQPEYLVKTNSLGGPEKGRYRCKACGLIYYTRKAWAKHAGMVPNIMGTCKGG